MDCHLFQTILFFFTPVNFYIMPFHGKVENCPSSNFIYKVLIKQL